MEPPFADETPTRTERIYDQYVGVCARIGQAASRPVGQRIPQGKLDKLCYERSRLRRELGNFIESR